MQLYTSTVESDAEKCIIGATLCGACLSARARISHFGRGEPVIIPRGQRSAVVVGRCIKRQEIVNAI